ncbi:MAG: hypothetical protein AAFN68_14480 [Pseudomonadota bacterium]
MGAKDAVDVVGEPYVLQEVLEDGIVLPSDMAKGEHLEMLPSVGVGNVAADG